MGLALGRPHHHPPAHLHVDGPLPRQRLQPAVAHGQAEGEETKEPDEPPVLDLRDEESVCSFIAEKYGDSGSGGRCSRCVD